MSIHFNNQRVGVNRANRFQYFVVLLAFLCGGLIGHESSAQEQSKPAPKRVLKKCENYTLPDLEAELGLRLTAVGKTKANIKSLIDGKEILTVPVDALFTVNLSDEAAVVKRVEELKAIFGHDKAPEIPDDEFLSCARKNEGLISTIGQIKKEQTDILKYRFIFLSLPADQRNSLVEAQKSGSEQIQQQQELATDISAAEQESIEAGLSIERAEEEARSAVDLNLRELATQRALLEKARQDLANAQVERSKDLKRQSEFYKISAEKLSALSALLLSPQGVVDYRKYFLEANEIWRLMVDMTFAAGGINISQLDPLPQLPKFPSKLLPEVVKEGVAEGEEIVAFRKAFLELRAQRVKQFQRRATQLEEYKNNHYQLLLQSSRLRSRLLEATIESGDSTIIELSNDYFLDLWREVRVVPYRGLAMFYGVAVSVTDRITGGVAGIISLVKEAFLLFFFIAIPVGTFLGLKRLTAKIDQFRDQLVRTAGIDGWQAWLALWLRRISPYIPWVLMLIGLWVAEGLLARSDLSGIAGAFFYVKYYIWYRIFKLFVSISLSRAAYSSNLRAISGQKARIEKTAKTLSLFFFAAFVLLRLTEGTVGTALVYRIVTNTAIYFGWGILAYCAWSWRDQIVGTVARTFPKKAVERVQGICNSRWGIIACLPVVVAIFVLHLIARIKHWISKFDVYKKLSVEILKRKLDVEEDDAEEVARKQRFAEAKQNYLKLFEFGAPADSELLIQPSHGLNAKVLKVVEGWVSEKTDDFSVAIYGEKGIGKSTVLKMVQEKMTGVEVVSLTVPPKLTSKAQVLGFLFTSLGIPPQDEMDKVVQSQEGRKKTLVLLDEAHNLFLSELGMFDGYRAFLEFVNAKIPNIFWCVVFNRRAWIYLDAVLGRNQYFRNVFEFKSFSDVDIQNMIMTRHRKSGLSLEFDEMILAASRSDDLGGSSHAETQFFRLLWGLSKGNARTAMALWNESVSMATSNRVKIGIPKPLSLKELHGLSESNYFVFGSILRHENLNVSEAISTTNLPEGLVRNALKVGEDIGALERFNDGRYRVNPLAQSRLIDFLLDKNIVYE